MPLTTVNQIVCNTRYPMAHTCGQLILPCDVFDCIRHGAKAYPEEFVKTGLTGSVAG